MIILAIGIVFFYDGFNLVQGGRRRKAAATTIQNQFWRLRSLRRWRQRRDPTSVMWEELQPGITMPTRGTPGITTIPIDHTLMSDIFQLPY